ncbi:MAG: hypothetical protein K1X75_14295 [Leptospirales bacterium]|nr:hypothetical protein [Leptospirales bacterium]
MKSWIRKIVLALVLLPLAWLQAQRIVLDRTAATVNVRVSVRGAWGPDQIPLRLAYVAVSYRPMGQPVCSPMLFFSIREEGSSGFGCRNGQRDSRAALQTDIETSGNRGLEARLMVPMTPSGPAMAQIPEDSAFIPQQLGTLQVLRGLRVPGAPGSRTPPEGQLYFKLNPDFNVDTLYEFAGERRAATLNGQRGIVLLQYFLETPEPPSGGSWMQFYDLLVETADARGAARSLGSYFGFEHHNTLQSLAYDRENKRYVFQIFVKTGVSDDRINEALQRFRFGFARRSWGGYDDSTPCTRSECILDPLRSFQASMPGRHGSLSYRMDGPLVLPARLSYRLATRDRQGRPVDNSELELRVRAVREGSERTVESVAQSGRWNPYTSRMLVERPGVSYGEVGPLASETRALLNLDDVDGARYNLQVRVVYRGVEFPAEAIGPGKPIESITLIGTVPGATSAAARPNSIFTEAHPYWQSYLVGKGFSDTWPANQSFDHYPLFEVLFKKPEARRETLRFELAPDSLPGVILASARRLSDNRVFESVASGNAALLNLEDIPGAKYQLSFRVRYEDRDYLPGQRPGPVRPGGRLPPAVLSIERNNSGQPAPATDISWQDFSIGQRQEHSYRVRFVAMLPVRPQPLR